MRILTVSHFFEAHGGGIERVAGHLGREFARLGAQPVWAASDADEMPLGEVAAVPLACINPIEKLTGLPMPLPKLRAIRTLAAEVGRSDAVIVHDALYATSIIAVMLAKMRRKRVVLIQHIAGIEFRSRVLTWAMAAANLLVTRPMLRAADVRIFISDTVRRALIGADERRAYALLFNGVDSTIFHPGNAAKSVSAMQDQPRNSAAVRNMLFVGRYVEKKGLSVLRALAASRPDLRFQLAGSGRIRPADWGLPNVRDLGARSPQELAELYRSSDLLVLPSVGEGYPLVIQEAMACGLPVVCGEPSNLADPEAAPWLRGVAVDLGDPEGSAERCARAIDAFSLLPADRAAMAEYARARYDWKKMARSLLALVDGGQTAARP